MAATTPVGILNLKQLEYFVRVAELGSFSRAALVLDIAQPALSRQVRLLETDLRVNLLTRTGRGVVLTDAGKRLFDHSVGILQLVARAAEDLSAARDEPSGRVVVGLPPSIGRLLTLPLVKAFVDDLPQARLAIVEGLSTHLAEWIATGRVDLGLLHNPEPNPALEITPVLEEPLGLVSPIVRAGAGGRGAPREEEAAAPAGKRVRTPPLLRLQDLSRFPLIVPDRAHAIRKLLEAQAALAGVKLDVAWEVSSVQAILDLVRAGYGHAVLARTALVASGQPEAFGLRPLAAAGLTSTLCLAVSAHRPATPLIRRTLGMIRDLLAAAPAVRAGHNRLR